MRRQTTAVPTCHAPSLLPSNSSALFPVCCSYSSITSCSAAEARSVVSHNTATVPAAAAAGDLAPVEAFGLPRRAQFHQQVALVGAEHRVVGVGAVRGVHEVPGLVE